MRLPLHAYPLWARRGREAARLAGFVQRRSANLVTVPANLMKPVSKNAQENAALQAKAEAFAGITEMARVLTRNEGLAKDRALLAATLQIFSEKCTVEVNTHMGSVAAISPLQWSAGPGEDSMCNPWPLMVSISVH
jgi:hypothetical protein